MVDGDATQPDVIRYAPFQQDRFAFRETLDDRSDNPIQAIDGIPPGFCLDVLLQFRKVSRTEVTLNRQKVVDAGILELTFIPLKALVDEIEVDDFFFFCGCKKFFIGCFPRTRWDTQERELIPHISRHLGCAFFIAQRQ